MGQDLQVLKGIAGDRPHVRVVDPGLNPPTRMLRSNLGFIYRGQVLRPVRGGSYWDKSYVFAGSDGSLGILPKASSFTENGNAEFAGRLQVPIRGDFSVKVNDRVDPTAP